MDRRADNGRMSLAELQSLILTMKQDMRGQLKTIVDMVGVLNDRMTLLEAYKKDQLVNKKDGGNNSEVPY